MPELPEVEVVRAGLEPAVSGARVIAVRVDDERALTRHDGPAEDFVDRLTGRTIAAAVRRGKFIWMPLDDVGAGPEALVAHLGMSGQILLGRGRAAATHRRIVLDVQPAWTDAAGVPEQPVELEFVDQRTFGSMAIDRMVPTADGAPAGSAGTIDSEQPDAMWRRSIPIQVAHIARDPLDPAFDADLFIARARKRNSGIKRVLLDQGIISGIGNIYADESLWAAKLHHDRPANRLPRATLLHLLDEVRGVLARALQDGGTSFDAQYVNVNGQSGFFSQRLAVYGQQGKPCPRCGAVIVRESFMNRSSHRCPVCQRPPR
ncbi:bifunctional DNA-formamidopyrimidine glycosylase/DNA-(apurinic or apyrimidinic site) lyase [Curtobacterium sp. RRHDQ10]|uniref:bifunctional DNA-formamidopyrimidine glycosylase/DNA-(apurinic or apyrimidinic site) lyase n=1 Tax=Curtobacterium phyllosphaerae TaxID=3413379 RepID=UPI003BF381D1